MALPWAANSSPNAWNLLQLSVSQTRLAPQLFRSMLDLCRLLTCPRQVIFKAPHEVPSTVAHTGNSTSLTEHSM